MAKLGGGRMPHIASDMVDAEGVRLIRDWIRQLPLEPTLKPEPPADFVAANLSMPTGAMKVLEAIDSGRESPRAVKEAVAKGSRHDDSRIRDLFERFVPEENRPRRLGPQINPQALLAVAGDAARGRALFTGLASLSCRNCHQVGGTGGQAGPALDQIGKKYNRAQLLESILEPSKTIEEKYVTYQVVTTDGVPLTGVVTERTAEGIVLRDAENKMVRLKHAEIEESTRQRQSLMPEGALSELTAQQAADLLSFLETCK
jgi:putative heme-binding domain-containing protein